MKVNEKNTRFVRTAAVAAHHEHGHPHDRDDGLDQRHETDVFTRRHWTPERVELVDHLFRQFEE